MVVKFNLKYILFLIIALSTTYFVWAGAGITAAGGNFIDFPVFNQYYDYWIILNALHFIHTSYGIVQHIS